MSPLSRQPNESKSQYVSRMAEEFKNLTRLTAFSKERERKMWRGYSGVGNGQWDEASLQFLESEGRPAHTYNICQRNIDQVVGVLIQNPHEVTLTPVDQIDVDMEEGVNQAQFLYDMDMDRFNADYERAKFIRNGLVHRGVLQWFPDYKDSELGNVGYRNLNPRWVWTSADWDSDDINDLGLLVKGRTMTGSELRSNWNNKSEEIDIAVANEKQGNSTGYVAQENHFQQNVFNDTNFYYNGRYLVLEMHFMVKSTETEVIDLMTGNAVTGKPQMVLDAAVASNPTRFKKVVRYKKQHRVLTIVPGLSLDLILDDGLYPFQFGRLAFEIFSEKNLFGEAQGLMEKLMPLQEALNKKESSLDYWEAQNNNGALVADKDAFPDEKDRKKLEAKGNKPGEVHWVDTMGKGVNNAIGVMPTGQAPTWFTQDVTRIQEYIGTVTSADQITREGMTASNQGASGSHFQAILSAKMVNFELLNQSLINIWQGMVGPYIKAAQYIYIGAERIMHNPKTGEQFTINQYIPDGNGGWQVLNPIENLSRYAWRTEFSPRGANKRWQEEQAIRNAIAATTNPLIKARLEVKLLQYSSDLKPSEKKEIIAAGKLYEEVVVLQMETQKAQLQQSLNQINNPQPPPQGVPGEPPQGPKEIAQNPGMGAIPGANGMAGRADGNNMLKTSPSDAGAGQLG